jgi:hypothetical protein
VIVAVDLGQLAAQAFAEAQRHAPRSYERRAASHLWVALTVPPAATVDAARNAITSFGDDQVQAAALQLLGQLAAAQNVPANQDGAATPVTQPPPHRVNNR